MGGGGKSRELPILGGMRAKGRENQWVMEVFLTHS